MAELTKVIARLEAAAGELRSPAIAPDRAAGLIEECARLAAEGAAELDREVRAGDSAGAAPGQMAFE